VPVIHDACSEARKRISASLAQELAAFGIKVTAVAPGAFRTDFLSPHSIRKSSVSDDYATTVGKTLAAFDDMAGRQIGDPVRAAKALLDLADAAEPPVHLLLGSDALRRTREKLDAVIEDMDRWEQVTIATDLSKEG
jgi:NAD(P)-dependent dehydrogenase (short-subunit alcohol dehydrogenase family)